MTTAPNQTDSITIILPGGAEALFVRGRSGAYWSHGDHMVGIFLLSITPGTEFWDGSPAQSFEAWSQEFADIIYDDRDPESTRLFAGAAKYLDAKYKTALNYFPLSRVSDEKEFQPEYSPAVDVGRRLLGELGAAEEEPLGDEPAPEPPAPPIKEPPAPAPAVVVYDDELDIDPLTRKLLAQGGELADEIREEMAMERASRERITGRELARPIEEARTWLLQLLAKRGQEMSNEQKPPRRVVITGYKDMPVCPPMQEFPESGLLSDMAPPAKLAAPPDLPALITLKWPGDLPVRSSAIVSDEPPEEQAASAPPKAETPTSHQVPNLTDAELAQLLRARGVKKLSDLKDLGIRLGFGFTAPKSPKTKSRKGEPASAGETADSGADAQE